MVRAVCARLYELMDILPEAKACRDVHPPSLQRAEELLCQFLTGWLCGSQLYRENHGHLRLRQRYLVAPIGPEQIAGWLACFHQARDEIVPASPLTADLSQRIDASGWPATPRMRFTTLGSCCSGQVSLGGADQFSKKGCDARPGLGGLSGRAQGGADQPTATIHKQGSIGSKPWGNMSFAFSSGIDGGMITLSPGRQSAGGTMRDL